MIRRAFANAIPLVAAFLMAACGAARPSHYYQLTLPASASVRTVEKPFPVTIVLGPMFTSHLYREDRIIYGTEREQMGMYESERWSEPPVEMIQSILMHDLRQTGAFKDVDLLRSGTRGDFILRGRLQDFKEVTGKAFVARVAFEVELHDTKTGATVWTHQYAHDEPVSGKDVPSVVAALDRNVQQGAAEVAAALVQYFSTR